MILDNIKTIRYNEGLEKYNHIFSLVHNNHSISKNIFYYTIGSITAYTDDYDDSYVKTSIEFDKTLIQKGFKEGDIIFIVSDNFINNNKL